VAELVRLTVALAASVRLVAQVRPVARAGPVAVLRVAAALAWRVARAVGADGISIGAWPARVGIFSFSR
jgi:hypothetical protein